jgi:16S rRNA processing protein RimM
VTGGHDHRVAGDDRLVASDDRLVASDDRLVASDDRLVASDDRLVALGRVVDAYGVKGWIKVQPYAGAGDSALLGARRWAIRRDASANSPALGGEIDIDAVRRHSDSIVAHPCGTRDRDDAIALRGAEVLVARRDFPPPSDGEYYWVDLVGCDVVDAAGAALGRVTAVDDHGAHPILTLDTGSLIPFVAAYVLDVDIERRRIVADWQAQWSR